MVKLKTALVSAINLLLIVILGGCFLLPEEEQALAPPLRAPDRIEFRTVEVTRGDIVDELRANGTIETRVSATVSFNSNSGRLKRLYSSSGRDVEEGELLAELENDELLRALERQEMYHRLAEIDFERTRRIPGMTRLDREAAEIYLALSAIDLEKAQTAVDNTQLYSPMAGRIVYSSPYRMGDFIDAYTTIFHIADVSDLVIRVSGDFASSIPLGATVYVIDDAKKHEGTIIQVPSLNPSDAGDRSIAAIDAPTIELGPRKLGTTLSIVYERGRAENVIVIERSYIKQIEGRSYVLILVDGVPIERTVVLGITNNSYAEIVDGLEEGDLLLQ